MIGPDPSQDDAMETLLAAGAGGHGDDRLRAAVLARTMRVVRFRRHRRRLALAGALAACYLAGLATTGTWRLRSERPPQTARELADAADRAPHAPREAAPAKPHAEREEYVASHSLTRFEIRRRSGDAHLRHPAELAPAIRDYTLALNTASDAERAIAPERDSWLLMALKNARMKEIGHEGHVP